MRVAHVVRQYLPSIGGMEEVVRSLAQHQRSESGYRPSIVTLDRIFREPARPLPASETLDGIPVLRLPYRGSERYPLCPQVLSTLRDADLVHVHGVDFFFDYLALTQSLHGKPMIASTHGGFFHTKFAQRFKRFYFNSVTRMSALRYRRIIATSESDGEIFSRIAGKRRLRVIENGVDLQKFDDASSRTLVPTLIYFGRWSANKGLLETLAVLAALCTQHAETPWQLIVAGREYDLDAAAITRHARALGVADRLRVVPGPDNAALLQLIAQASYYICQSRHEGFGIAPIEAMSAGLIPLLSDIPPFRRLVDSTGVGLLLDAADASGQAQQIAALHERLTAQARERDDADERRAGARRATAPYSWTGVAAHYVEQYDQILASR